MSFTRQISIKFRWWFSFAAGSAPSVFDINSFSRSDFFYAFLSVLPLTAFAALLEPVPALPGFAELAQWPHAFASAALFGRGDAFGLLPGKKLSVIEETNFGHEPPPYRGLNKRGLLAGKAASTRTLPGHPQADILPFLAGLVNLKTFGSTVPRRPGKGTSPDTNLEHQT